MMKCDNVTGFVTIEENKYSFFLNDYNINGNFLSSSKDNYYSSLKRRGHVKYIKASYNLGGTIVFYNVNYSNNMFDKSINAKTYAVFLARMLNENVEYFDAINFKGNIINKFYPPYASAVIDRGDEEIDDGAKTIKVKPFKEKTNKFETKIFDQQVEMELTVCSPEDLMEDSTNLGELCSSFKVIFKNQIPIKDLMKWIAAIKKVFCFLYFREEIKFDEIELQSKNQTLFTKIGNLYLNDTFDEGIPKKASMCVQYKNICKNIGELISLIARDEFHLLCLPKNKKESLIVSPEKYVFTCGSFEKIFNYTHEDYIDNDEDFKKVYNSIIDFLDKEDEKYKGNNKRAREWIKKIKSTIQRESKNINHKFITCFKENKELLAEFIKDVELRYQKEIDEKELGENFSGVRNYNAHGDVIEYSKEAIMAFEFGRAMIYAMILTKVGFSIEEAKYVIKKLFISQ